MRFARGDLRPTRFIQKRPPAFVLAPEYLAAAAVPKKRLSRDFRCLSIFDFFDSIDPSETSSQINVGGRAGHFSLTALVKC
jgi:hypothetical protein